MELAFWRDASRAAVAVHTPGQRALAFRARST
jgi:hypothetical protein